ncbi:30S ribosomal protein S24e [Candidatus Micrarchaeota archaeon]|nr:30S ribosomal protein S24e [Candidatus Micrarchaeota archaeon]
MDLEISQQKENTLLNRKEVNFSVVGSGPTPNRKEVKEALCSKLGADPKLVIVEIKQGFGIAMATGFAKVYKDEASMKIEEEYKLRRERGEKGPKKKEEKKAPEKK